MRISLELVPRDEATLLKDAALLRGKFPSVTQLNIPDLLRFPLRGWEACAITRSHFPVSIPHLRAIDMPPDGPLKDVEALVGAGITEVLVVTGDPPAADGSRRSRLKRFPKSVQPCSPRVVHREPCSPVAVHPEVSA